MGVFEAKTHFSALVNDAAAGKRTIVTKNGQPVAEIGPVSEDRERKAQETLQRIRALRKRLGLRGLNIKELMNEGRR